MLIIFHKNRYYKTYAIYVLCNQHHTIVFFLLILLEKWSISFYWNIVILVVNGFLKIVYRYSANFMVGMYRLYSVMVYTKDFKNSASLCDAHIYSLSIYAVVAPDYAAYLSVSILDRAQNAKEREIGSSTMYSVQCTCVDLIINIYHYYNYLCIWAIIFFTDLPCLSMTWYGLSTDFCVCIRTYIFLWWWTHHIIKIIILSPRTNTGFQQGRGEGGGWKHLKIFSTSA